MTNRIRPDRNLAMELTRVTEAAALAAGSWIGRGDKIGADRAAVDAMRFMIDSVSMDGVVVIGEGEKDEAPMLYNGMIDRVGEDRGFVHLSYGWYIGLVGALLMVAGAATVQMRRGGAIRRPPGTF